MNKQMDEIIKKEGYDKLFNNLKLMEVEEDGEKYIGWYGTGIEEQDLPIVLIYKNGKKEIVNLPPEYKGEPKTIYNADTKQKEEEQDMDTNKIKKLLKTYGAQDEEIKNFMNDLKEMKDEQEEQPKEFNYLDHIKELKLTEEGKDIIEKAPTMKKEELEQLVKNFLNNN